MSSYKYAHLPRYAAASNDMPDGMPFVFYEPVFRGNAPNNTKDGDVVDYVVAEHLPDTEIMTDGIRFHWHKALIQNKGDDRVLI